ncbi:hypothetical protein L1987_04572 [Smallanthus sonchifolius]|uniref:Uncharacterized protein n=1 Tax=Smallanthus sonchifolius TaxID=185202 RepID=A0ACB9JSX2_9ASTR|nr:hypothetical protein L1987_04572 [Smallanthus sonchifolius]
MFIRNNNRSLTSKNVAAYINHAVRADIAFPVKQIQAYIKETLKVDISYIKAWRARRISVDSIYGNWKSNFEELPKYITALMSSNNGTIVEWYHQTDGSSEYNTFKYVFWAFGPVIKAFQHCRPIICVDGTHLTGSYRGKLLIAVTKDANKYILSVAYAIVDEETNDSWDRHKDIIHAMNNLDMWKEPLAYHRFCLRHVRSNFMKKFKNVSLKRLCWSIGSTTQRRKYRSCIQQMKKINPEAWEYLKQIGFNKWTLMHDEKDSRWGNLTTNISESLNNALRGARVLPIKACIDYTFNKVVQQFRNHTDIAKHCKTSLPPRVWHTFDERDNRGQDHTVTEFNEEEGWYRVTSMMQTNQDGDNDYIVQYKNKKCSCGKWQAERFPCSHAISICRHRGERPHDIVHRVYKNATYLQQYQSDFRPLPHPALWIDPGWRIIADESKIVTSRGRRRARRIHNKMDVHYREESVARRCGICNETGHNRKRCPNRS